MDENAPITVRPTTDADLPLLRLFFSGLAPRTRLLRFHTGMPRFPDRVLRELGRHAPPRRVSLVAVTRHDLPVAHGMWVRDDKRLGEADLALVVAENSQGRGVGGRMLAELAATAAQNGVRDFTGLVLGDNRRAVGAVSALGGRTRGGEFTLPVGAVTAALCPRRDDGSAA